MSEPYRDILCQCGNSAIKKTVRKEGRNQGRIFWSCSSGECPFFKWDEPLPGDKGYKSSKSFMKGNQGGNDQGGTQGGKQGGTQFRKRPRTQNIVNRTQELSEESDDLLENIGKLKTGLDNREKFMDKTASSLLNVLASSCSMTQSTLEVASRHESMLKSVLEELKSIVALLPPISKLCPCSETSDSDKDEKLIEMNEINEDEEESQLENVKLLNEPIQPPKKKFKTHS